MRPLLQLRRRSQFTAHSTFRALSHAAGLFPDIQESDQWNLIIRHASATNPSKALSLFQEMRKIDRKHLFCDDPFICASLIKACAKLQAVGEGKSIHCRLIRLRLDREMKNAWNSLLSLYMGCERFVSYADKVFDIITEKSVVTVNCMLSGHAKRGNLDYCLRLFVDLLRGGYGPKLKPNYVSFVILMSSCTDIRWFRMGITLHCLCLKHGFEHCTEVCNVLIDFYAKFGSMVDGESIFRNMAQKDLISWNAMICGCIDDGDWIKAITLFRKMRIECVKIDRVPFSRLISSCAARMDLHLGKTLHAQATTLGLEYDLSVGTSLINMYAKCKKIESARKLFDELPNQKIESWNSMMHAYVENGLPREASALFDDFESIGLKPDEITVLGMIMACRDSGEIDRGIKMHSIVEGRKPFKESTVLQNALIDMYVKCGSTEKARAVFSDMPMKDVVSWTSMIVGLALNGEGEEAIATFGQMIADNFVPNSATFVGVLSACGHAGLVDEGMKIYSDMIRIYGIEPKIEHFGCVVDMLARAGKIEDALRFVGEMPVEPNEVIWRILASSCRLYNHFSLGMKLVGGAIEVNVLRGGAENMVVSSNMFAEAGKWGDALNHRWDFMAAHRSASKLAGKSLVSY